MIPSPRLKDLPSPPPGKTGWPWTEESHHLMPTRSDGDFWPGITVVTPSFNYGRFIEETIRSILLQGYPNLEYLILDGGSSDNSVEIIEKYSPWLTYWTSEPDSGQSAVINRGLEMGSGLFATWINSDDMLCKDAIYNHATQIGFAPNIVYVGNCLYIDEASNFLSTHQSKVHSLEDLVRISTIWRAGGCIVQPETLFPRELALSVGGLNPNLHFSMDFELWGNLLLAGAKFEYSNILFGISRNHAQQKTKMGLSVTQGMVQTASSLVALNDGFSEETKIEILESLEVYFNQYQKNHRQSEGRFRSIRYKLRKLADTFLR